MVSEPNKFFASKYHIARFASTCLIVCSLVTLCRSQQFSAYERDEVQGMLQNISDEIKKHYYDPLLHGVNWDAKVKEAKDRIDKADSLNRGLSQIAAVLDSLNDSHTFFLPPPRPYKHDYGFLMEMIGDHCYVIGVRPGSDAETKGVKSGDEILGVNNYAPAREDFWRMQYVYNVLRPQPGLNLKLRTPTGEERTLLVDAKMHELPPVRDLTGERIWDMVREIETSGYQQRVRYSERGRDLLVVKLPTFNFAPYEVDSILGKMRNYNAVVLDLRGNLGGSGETLRPFLGGLFENKVRIGDRVGRNSNKPLETETRRPFTGKVVILLDSNSASASELFARVVQLEKRGLIVGDRSAGKVMESRQYSYQMGTGRALFYGASITEADVRMTDGQSLEHNGVIPDKLILPTASDLANGRDPVLSDAAEMLGIKMSAEEAARLFPFDWPKE